MKLHRTLPIMALGFFFGYAQAQDILTPALTSDLSAECVESFNFCAPVLKLHGEGKDDRALELLSANASPNTPNAKEHYKIAQSRPKDAFWKQVATAGSTTVNCEDDLSDTLDLHFNSKAYALGKADDDAAASSFLALSDLLRSIPPQGFAAKSRPIVANTYRFCFSDSDSLFALVKRKLGRTP